MRPPQQQRFDADPWRKSNLTVLAIVGGIVLLALIVIAILVPQAARLMATAALPTAQPTLAPIDNTLAPTPTDTSTPHNATVTGARLGGPILAFNARYGSDNPPGPIYQWNTTISGVPVQLTVSLSRNGDTLDGQTRAVIVDIAAPSSANAPWSAAQEVALVSSFLPPDAHHINDVAGSGTLGPDHISMSQQLANSLAPAVFALGASSGSTPGMFDWQCSTQQPYCEIAPGTNS